MVQPVGRPREVSFAFFYLVCEGECKEGGRGLMRSLGAGLIV